MTAEQKMYSEWAENPPAFKRLPVADQLAVIADIVLYWADAETDAMKDHGKSSLEVKRCHDRVKYWTAYNQNLKKIVELGSVADFTGDKK